MLRRLITALTQLRVNACLHGSYFAILACSPSTREHRIPTFQKSLAEYPHSTLTQSLTMTDQNGTSAAHGQSSPATESIRETKGKGKAIDVPQDISMDEDSSDEETGAEEEVHTSFKRTPAIWVFQANHLVLQVQDLGISLKYQIILRH